MVAGEEELLGRQAPHSLEAEQSVLGAMLIDSRCVADVIGLLKPEDFYLQRNREIYETIYAMFNFSQVIDPVTVLDKMQERGVWQDRSIEYIKQLMEITPTLGQRCPVCLHRPGQGPASEPGHGGFRNFRDGL